MVPCIVDGVHEGEDYCNVTLLTEEPMHPGNQRSTMVLNTRQTIKAEP